MSMFRNWLKKKGYDEGFAGLDNPVEKFNFNKEDEDFAEDHDRIESELFKLVMRKYPEESMNFFQTISSRGDAEVANLLKKLDHGRVPRLSHQPQHPSNHDEIVPSSADTGYNSEMGG